MAKAKELLSAAYTIRKGKAYESIVATVVDGEIKLMGIIYRRLTHWTFLRFAQM